MKNNHNYKIGDVLESKQYKKEYTVVDTLSAVVFCVNENGNVAVFHYKKIDKYYTVQEEVSWKSLTPEEAKKHIGEIVWCSFSRQRPSKLIWVEENVNFEFKVLDKHGNFSCYGEISLYNDNGERANWGDE